MKSITRFAKRALSLVLCLTMVMTTMLFFDIGITKSEAAVSVNNPTASDELPDVLFYVPEAVYLRPVSYSWIGGSTSTFHFFIENDVVNGNDLKTTPTVNQAIPTIGNVRFQYNKAKEGSVQLSYRWLSSDLKTALSGNGIRLGSTDVGVNQNLALSKASGANYYHTTITAANSKSPELAAGTTGCYIEWTVKYHDNADNLDKSITAYTYVYKPYVVPVSTSGRTKNTTGDSKNFCQQISWITGFHAPISNTTQNPKYAKYSTVAKDTGAMMPFQTSAPLTAINDNTAGVVGFTFSKPSGATLDSGAMMNSYFASADTSYAYFRAGQAGHEYNNYGVSAYHSDSANVSTTISDSTTYNLPLHAYDNWEDGGGATSNDHSVFLAINNTAVAGIAIDTSRYTNLNQVPNLGIGLLFTDSEDSSGGAWYVADYTGRTQTKRDGTVSNIFGGTGKATYFTDDGWHVWTDKGNYIAHEANPSQHDGFTGDAKNCGLKYAGTWPKALASTGLAQSEQNYAIKTGAATDDDGDGAAVTTIMHLRAYQYNKANLRNAVANAQKEFAHLGIYDNSYNSRYYNNTGKYTAFVTAYKDACKALAMVNETITNPDTLANNLNNALSALKSDTASRKTGKAYQYNVGLIVNEDGSFRLVNISGATHPEVPYYLRDKVEFTADTYSGYTYIGMYKMESNLAISSLVNEAYDVVSASAFTSDSNRVNNSVSQAPPNNRQTSFTATSTVSTSTAVATFNGSTVTYPYAYDTDITYIYVYQLNENEVIFGNEFDFDKFRWVGASGGTATADHLNNTVTFSSTSSNTDGYTAGYNIDQKGYMTLIPGRTYEFSCDYENLSSSAANVSMFLFSLASAPTDPSTYVAIGTSGTEFKSVSASATAKGSGKLTGTITIPTGRPYATIRVGSQTASISVKFSNIVVRDITTFTNPLQTNAVTVPDPINKTGVPGASVTGFPTISRPGYVFAGWSEDRQANGNGGALVTSTTIPANGNEKLYPVWRTNVTYNTGGGSYRADPINRINYKAEGRFNLDVDTVVAVSNRGRYERDDASVTDPNWNSTDLNYSYVPYRFGYNFNGWKVTGSIDPALVGQTFWPGETVPAYANVEFTADWVEADAIGTSLQIIESTNNGDNNNTNASLYPGQIEFYSFTPTQRNMYVSAFTFGTNVDTEINWFNADFSESEINNNAKEVADQYEYENSGETFGYYGLLDEDSNIAFFKEANSLLTKQLTKNEKSYYGVSLHNLGAYTVNTINFRIREHKVVFDLNPNDGNFDGSYANEQVDGFGGESTELTTDIERHGYVFSGWQTENREEIQKDYTLADGKCVVPGEDNTTWLSGYTQSFQRTVYLKAKWTAERFTLIYDGNRGSASTVPEKVPSSVKMTYDSTFMVPEEPPEMKGYTFKGWSLDKEKPEGVETETLYTKTNRELSVAVVNSLYDKMFNASGNSVTLYARWAPNVIIVRYKNSAVSSADDHTQKFFFDTPQDLDAVDFEAATYTVNFYNVNPENGTETLVLTDSAELDLDGWESNADVINPATGKPYYYTNGQLGVINPNGVFGNSDAEEGAEETILNAKWKGGNSTVNAPVIVNDDAQYVLAGWADPTDSTTDKGTVDYLPGQDFTPKSDSSLYAVWYSTQKAEEAENNLGKYTKEQDVIAGIKIKDADLTAENSFEEISAGYSIVEYDTENYQKLVNAYITAKNNFEAVKTGTDESAKITANNNLLTAIKNLEAVKNPDTAQKAVDTYIDKFTIEYADSVPESERLVEEGEHSVAEMNLNHYTEATLESAKTALDEAKPVVYATEQGIINKAVITLAKAYANKQDVKESTPVYNVYDTVDAIKSSGLTSSTDISAMSYVYTGKGNNTYYCYTNSQMPVMYVTVDEDLVANDRVCYPTSAEFGGDIVMTAGANTIAPTFKQVEIDDAQKSRYSKYTSEGIGLKPIISDGMGGTTVGDADYYNKKTVIELRPDFSNVNPDAISSTVKYTFKAYDDAFALTENDINYADAAALASGAEKGKLNDIPQGEYATNKSDGEVVTPENTITILIDYHVSADGVALDVNGKQVYGDEWLKQYHLTRTSGGVGNWDMVKRDDAIYTIDDPTYGQSNFGSFTYTFRVGGANDFTNCVLTSSDVNDVVSIVKENYDAIRSVPFTSAKATTRFAHEKDAQGNDILDSNGNPKVYVETVPAGTGLGFKEWPQTTWSYNYYPASQVYTYVHVVDRWGNVVDKVIETPNVDANAVQFLSQSVGDVTAAELGGSGIDTMTFSAQSFDIIPDDNSTFDGTTYTTTGNTIKLYTGEANKTYNLTANDVAANTSKGTATTDADGYLTITVEDLAFDTQSGAYTFTLNDKTINLYAEVEDVILSAEDVTVDAGEKAIVSVTTTTAPTMVQLVSASGTTATAIEYTEDEDGNRVWQIGVKMSPGSYEYEVRAKVDGKWISEGETVTVTVIEPTVFVGAVTAVEYTPSTSTRNEFMFTVTGRPDKIQVIEPDGGTRTYDRYHAKVVIVSYDAEGNVIGSMSRELSYEVWTIEMNVPADIELTAIARYGRAWSTDAPYKYTVVLATPEFDDEVYSMELASTEGRLGKVQATVITGLDVRGVRFEMDNDTTTTYYTATEADGKLTYVGNAWMNHYGENIIIVKIRVNNAWLNAGELTYLAI